jgi:hypothetical protein
MEVHGAIQLCAERRQSGDREIRHEGSRNYPHGNPHRHDPGSVPAIVRNWMATAKHPRFNRPFAEMAYQPMLEVMRYLRDHGYKTYIVTGGGQDFVRAYAQQVYGIPPEQIIGSALDTQYTYNKAGHILIKEPKILLNNDLAGKPEDIYLFIGKRPVAAFGNSPGDRQMLEYTQAGGGARLMMLVLHDDPVREFAYGPAQGLPDTKIGTSAVVIRRCKE